MTTPEGAVKKQIRSYLREKGARQFWPVQTGYGSPALDCIACYRGYYLEFEVKRPGVLQATTRQNFTMKQVEDAGGISFVTDGLSEVMRAVELIDAEGV